MLHHQRAHRLELQRIELFEGDHLRVAELAEFLFRIEHVGDAAAHAGGEVSAGWTEHHHPPAGHVLAAVIADSLHDGNCTAVSDRESLSGAAAEEGAAAGRSVEDGVA